MRMKFYVTNSGRNPVTEFLKECSEQLREDFADAAILLENGQQLQMPMSRSLASIFPGLHELRLRDRGGQVRVFYYIKRGHAIYLLHAIRKKTQELLKRDIEVVLRRIRELSRMGNGEEAICRGRK